MTPHWHTQNGAMKLAWALLTDPRYCGILAQQGVDAVLLDAQHGYHDEASIHACIAAVMAAGKPALVRVPLGRWDMASRALDFGAAGIVAPMINSADDAHALVEACKYMPVGNRSFGPVPCAALWGMEVPDYVQRANDVTLTLPMVETAQAVAALDDILAVDGVDGIFIGPADLSISVRNDPVPDPYGPATVDMIREAAAKTIAAGKLFGAYTSSAAHANLVHDMGGRLISVGDDRAFLSQGAGPILQALAF